MIAILFHFEDLPSNGSIVRNLNYTLQINQTDSRSHGKLVNHIQYIQLPAQMKIEKALCNLITLNLFSYDTALNLRYSEIALTKLTEFKGVLEFCEQFLL
jgi:hypothetical protein